LSSLLPVPPLMLIRPPAAEAAEGVARAERQIAAVPAVPVPTATDTSPPLPSVEPPVCSAAEPDCPNEASHAVGTTLSALRPVAVVVAVAAVAAVASGTVRLLALALTA